jgi:SAM-dependent methyltransferase
MTHPASYDAKRVAHELASFYTLQGDVAADPYLARKAMSSSSRRELAEAYGKIRFALFGARTVLDWGCRHGVFGWLARQDLGVDFGLWGCDVVPTETYAGFHAASGLQYAWLGHPWKTPFADDSFDTIIGGGTLEHVANENESLNELWRILKPNGRLVLTHLPNAWSPSEWLSRHMDPQRAHPRRYRLAPLRERLLRRGFMPLHWGHHQLLPATAAHPNSASGRWIERLYPANSLLERLWPLNRFSTTLWIVAEKRLGF